MLGTTMLGHVAAFEFRYQVRSPLVAASAGLFFLATFVDMSMAKLLTAGGGNVLFNSPHAIIVSHLVVSLLFLFVGAAFVSNVIVRDDQTGFGPLVRATRLTTVDYLVGRFLGAFAVGALVLGAATLGAWLGTLMPFANHEMLGPNRLAAFAYGYGVFALPNALIISAILFALATTTRSTAGTFIGVVGLLTLYFVSQGAMEGRSQLATVRVLADPFGASTYMASSRYFTAAELNAGVVPVTALMIQGRLLWIALSVFLLWLTCRLFRFSDNRVPARGPSWRQSRRQRRESAVAERPAPMAGPARRPGPLARPRFDRRTALAQFGARTAMDVRYILTSPAFPILLLIAFAFTLPGLLTPSGFAGVMLYPLTFLVVPVIKESFDLLLLTIAAYYAGELVWRDRERRVHEIIDATPMPAWALMLPTMIGVSLVLFTTLLVSAAVGLLVQLLKGGVDLAPADYLRWLLVPGGVDAALVAALAVFFQTLSPSKYAGWGVTACYIVLLFAAPLLGLEHPLFVYGTVPPVPLSDMTGGGIYSAAAWWFRLFWAATAVLLLVAAQLLWPRGTERRLRPRLPQVPGLLVGWAGAIAVGAAALVVLSGSWIAYNTLVLNAFRTTGDSQQYLAEVEKRFFGYARLPQPVVTHLELDVALYPEQVRAEVRGRYRLANDTGSAIERVHVRLIDRDLHLVDLDVPGARLERNDEAFGYRIYRFDTPMQPGDVRTLAFRTYREQRGFRASGTEMGLAPNGTNLTTVDLTPRIGMSDVGLLEDPAARRRYGLPARQPFPRLSDEEATRLIPNGDLGWTTADITISTSADQLAAAPGRRVSERVENGRRIARFVSAAPIKNFFSIQSGRYAVRTERHGGVEQAIYFHPAHHWNVDRMMTAMGASLDYYRRAFGPYQFDQARIVERPAYWGGGQAFANTVALGETAGFAMDMRGGGAPDMVTMFVAHELAHQWWGQQVLGARMQGASLLYETLAQYSALMVASTLGGEDSIRAYLQFQRDRYLSGRRTQVLAEEPLVSVDVSQDHIAYGKGALALYHLQRRIGADAVNRALRRFVDRYRFTVAPYPRSVDLIALLREEVTTPADQGLITDLFERITLYDLRVDASSAVRRADGRWDVTVAVEAKKFYADGSGREQEAALGDRIEIGLFTAEPGGPAFGTKDVLRMELRQVRSGRQVFRFVSDTKPTHAGVDPYTLYIDRNARDNVARVTG